MGGWWDVGDGLRRAVWEVADGLRGASCQTPFTGRTPLFRTIARQADGAEPLASGQGGDRPTARASSGDGSPASRTILRMGSSGWSNTRSLSVCDPGSNRDLGVGFEGGPILFHLDQNAFVSSRGQEVYPEIAGEAWQMICVRVGNDDVPLIPVLLGDLL